MDAELDAMPRLLLSRLYRRGCFFLKSRFFWRGRVRPWRMYRNGRPVDPDFLATEKLFFRCRLDSVDERGQMTPAGIRFPDQSVNREKYSRCTDVLLPDGSPQSTKWLLYGVAVIQVEDLPAEMRLPDGVACRFSVEHEPCDDNYAHSELRVYKNEQRVTDKNGITKTSRKEYRTRLAFRARVIVLPLV